jgi:hypothetical protein
MPGEVTVGQLKLVHAANPSVLIALEWGRLVTLEQHSYEAFIGLLERAMDWVVAQLCENPKDFQARGENDITREIVVLLRAMGFTVGFDATVGGHCDIVVTFGDYQWLCEAKIYTSYAWLYKGYLQLLTRYSTGQPDQDRGAMLIYFLCDGMQGRMTKWCDALTGRRQKDGRQVTAAAIAKPASSFRSEQSHPRTGRIYSVKHYPLPLHWEPEV